MGIAAHIGQQSLAIGGGGAGAIKTSKVSVTNVALSADGECVLASTLSRYVMLVEKGDGSRLQNYDVWTQPKKTDKEVEKEKMLSVRKKACYLKSSFQIKTRRDV